ncbi:hypothetical protein SEA_UPYO_36 [Gordonia phage Upyo]|nr:hypothetical protein SEA_UPYO_36 [Gordonia phage Upyo]
MANTPNRPEEPDMDTTAHIHDPEFCHFCEAEMAELDAIDQWNALAPAERIAIRWANAGIRLALDLNAPRPGLATYGQSLPF